MAVFQCTEIFTVTNTHMYHVQHNF